MNLEQKPIFPHTLDVGQLILLNPFPHLLNEVDEEGGEGQKQNGPWDSGLANGITLRGPNLLWKWLSWLLQLLGMSVESPKPA